MFVLDTMKKCEYDVLTVAVNLSICPDSVHSHFPVKVQAHNVRLGLMGRNLVIKEIPNGQLKLLHVSNLVVGLAVQFVVA